MVCESQRSACGNTPEECISSVSQENPKRRGEPRQVPLMWSDHSPHGGALVLECGDSRFWSALSPWVSKAASRKCSPTPAGAGPGHPYLRGLYPTGYAGARVTGHRTRTFGKPGLGEHCLGEPHGTFGSCAVCFVCHAGNRRGLGRLWWHDRAIHGSSGAHLPRFPMSPTARRGHVPDT